MRVGTRPESPVDAIGMAAGLVPNAIFEGWFAPLMSRTIMAGVSLGIFDAIDDRPGSAADLAARLDLDAQGVDALLVALQTMGYVDFRDGAYTNTKQASKHLVANAEQPLTDTIGVFGYDVWRYMGHLEEVVRSGEPVGDLHTRPAGDPWWESYMRGLFQLSQIRASQIIGLIPTKNPRTLLDVAGGHGGFSLAMCRKHPGLRATVFELAGAAEVGRKIMGEQEGGEAVNHQVGDMFTGDLGSGYDVAMANSILHHFGPEENVRLLERIRGALAPGGTMAVVEQERPPEGKAGEQIGALTGVLFYVTSKVRTYTARELEGFLREAGFGGIKARRHFLAPGIVVVSGRGEPA